MLSRCADQPRNASCTAPATKLEPVSTSTSPSSVAKAETLAKDGHEGDPGGDLGHAAHVAAHRMDLHDVDVAAPELVGQLEYVVGHGVLRLRARAPADESLRRRAFAGRGGAGPVWGPGQPRGARHHRCSRAACRPTCRAPPRSFSSASGRRRAERPARMPSPRATDRGAPGAGARRGRRGNPDPVGGRSCPDTGAGRGLGVAGERGHPHPAHGRDLHHHDPGRVGAQGGEDGRGRQRQGHRDVERAVQARPAQAGQPSGPRAVTASKAKAPAADRRRPLWPMCTEDSASAPAKRYSRSWCATNGMGRRRSARPPPGSGPGSPVVIGALSRGGGGPVAVLGGGLVLRAWSCRLRRHPWPLRRGPS